MKRYIALLLSFILCVSSLTGCITQAPEPSITEPIISSDDLKIVDKLSDIIDDADNVYEDIIDLAESLTASAMKFETKLEEAKVTGDLVDAKKYIKDMNAYRDDIEEYLEDIEALNERVDKLKTPSSSEADACITAALAYFSMMTACLTDLDSVMVFYLDQEKAMEPFSETNENSDSEDYLELIDGLYIAVDETMTNMKSIKTCPEYMKESFSIYIRKFGIYENMLESMYIGYSLGDPLRFSSSLQLYERELIEESKYSLEMFSLIVLQFDKVSERLAGTISQLRDEIGASLKSLKKAKEDMPVITFSYQENDPEVSVEFEIVDSIYPNLYNSLDSVINLTASTDYGKINALVTAEIPGFTQVYEQKVTISNQVTKLLIKPVLLPDELDLSSSKETQIIFSVLNEDTGKTIIQESHTVDILSIYDFALSDDEFGITSRDNVLSWLTPESEGILKLRRDAVTWMDTYTGGQANSLVGYQDYGIFEDVEMNTYLQIVALQAAISETGVRYNNGAFSLSSNANQRVLLPDDVLESKSGICIETAILFATAIQSAGMHPMILFLPGHAQVAVETWLGSGEYFLVETTLLPFTATDEENNALVTYFTNDEWTSYLDDPYGDGSGPIYVVDCDLVIPLGLQGITYE